jgi:hypothetical protein
MPTVALIAVVVIAGCGAALFVASRSKQQPTRRSRFVRQQDTVGVDPLSGYGAWQFAGLTSSDATAASSNVVPPDTPAHDDRTDDPRVPDDDACRVAPDSQFNFDVERDDSCNADSSSDNSTDSSSDSSRDSGSSD